MPGNAVNLDWVLLPFAGAFGAVVGSFLNAAIYRLPRNISLIKVKRSFCPRCKAQIAWYDNVPVLSYLLLLGRCRSCRGRISPRYLVVELLTAGLFTAIYWHVRILNSPEALAGTGMHPLGWSHLVVYPLFTAGLILAAFCDLEDYEETEEEKREAAERASEYRKKGRNIEQEEGPAVYGIIPDEVTIGGLVLALPLALVFPAVHWNALHLVPWDRLNAVLDSALGAVAGGVMIWGTGLAGKLIFRKEAMGWGDVKLLAMIGAILGWKAAVMVFFLAPVFGAIFGITMRILTGTHYLRYGPFLAAAAVMMIFYEPLVSGYFENCFRQLAGSFSGGPFAGADWWQLDHRVPLVSFEPER